MWHFTNMLAYIKQFKHVKIYNINYLFHVKPSNNDVLCVNY